MDKYALTVATFDKAAQAYQDKYMDQSLYAPGLDAFCAALAKPDASVLDLACGPGNVTRYLLARHPGWRILGVDLAPQMLQLARRNNPAARFELMDCRDIARLGRRFDGIACGFALPYLAREDVEHLIRDAAGLLHPGGVLYLSAMEGDYARSGFQAGSSGDLAYIHYHEAEFLEGALRAQGFDVRYRERLASPAPCAVATTDLVLLAMLPRK